MNKLENLGRTLVGKTLSESAEGKKAGVVNIVLGSYPDLKVIKGCRKAIELAYDAGFKDAMKALKK